MRRCWDYCKHNDRDYHYWSKQGHLGGGKSIENLNWEGGSDIFWAFSLLKTDIEEPRTLWNVLPLIKWSWVVWKWKLSKPGERACYNVPPWSLPQLLPWSSVTMGYKLAGEINPFLSRMVFVMVFVTTTESNLAHQKCGEDTMFQLYFCFTKQGIWRNKNNLK